MNSARDYGYTVNGVETIDWSIKVRPGLHFRIATAEGDRTPYRFEVLRAHRDAGYWECVCQGGGHPARHGGIHIHHHDEILRQAYAD